MSSDSKTLGRAIGIAVLLTASLLPTAPARAEFSVGPAVRDLRIPADEARAGSFAVRLEGESRAFAVQLQDAVQLPEGGYAYTRPSRSRYSASTWLAVTPRTFNGAPDRMQPIDFRVRVPRDAEPGDHVASITVTQLPRRREHGTTALRAIAFRINVRVPGALREQVEIPSLATPAVAGRGPIEARAVVRNTGNVRLDFDRGNAGVLEIVGGGEATARLPFAGQLHPGRSRAFTLRWEDPPLVGRFTARAGVRTHNGRDTRSKPIWVIPWRQGGALLLVALASGLVYLGRRRRRVLVTESAG
jgi:hypothetical protein